MNDAPFFVLTLPRKEKLPEVCNFVVPFIQCCKMLNLSLTAVFMALIAQQSVA
jgi:hypothetical protein